MQDGYKYSPELRDIIERPQSKFTTGVFVFLLLFVMLLVLLGVIVKSPDTIVADVRVSSSNPPIVLKPQSSGRIRFIKDILPGEAEGGEYLAFIDNPARYEDIQKISKIVNGVEPFSVDFSIDDSMMSLGEVSAPYYDFKYALQSYRLLTSPENEYSSQIEMYKKRLQYDRADLENCRKSYENSLKQFRIKRQQFETDSALFVKNVLLEAEYHSAELDILNAERYVISGKSEIDSKMRSITENIHQIKEFERKYQEQLQLQYISVETTYKELISQIKGWEDKYVLKSDDPGHVELANLISDGDFITAGTPVFNVVYKDINYYAIAMLSTTGAGKVKAGERANLKLDSFPYAEYGTLSGFVETVSLNPIEKYYLVYISLPNGLVSTTGTQLFFAETLYGQAEIITEERRLISRIFNRIYEMFSSKKPVSEDKQIQEEQSQINF